MFPCPHCGGPVPDGARVCPHCGSDDETGWNPDAEYLSVELPEQEDEPHEGTGVSLPFGLTVVLVSLLGLAALAGAAALASPVLLLGAVAAACGVLLLVRRHRSNRP